MQSFYAERFEREIGCTEAEWQRCLPEAIGDHFWKLQSQSAGVRIGEGALGLSWRVGAPRVIALLRLPRLLVRFRFCRLDEAQRYAFMKRLDLYLQRGGG
jgi:hypothetical protein